MTASRRTVPWMRAILARGGYSGWGPKTTFADSTWPPTRMRLGVCGFGGGGGGGAELKAPPITPPRTPPKEPPGTPPTTPPTTPTWLGGGVGSSFTWAMFLGMTVGAFITSSTLILCTIRGAGAAAAGGGGGGGGGGG